MWLLFAIPAYTGKLASKFRLQTAIKTDERVRLMDEIISGVQVIKMYAWEKPFCTLVELARRLELKVVIKSSYIRGIYMTFSLFTTRMALYSTLVLLLMFGHELTADKVFVVSSYFNALSYTMSGMFVRGIAELAECLVAVRRLQNFLMYEEYENSNVIVCKQPSNNYKAKIHSESDKISEQDIPYIDGVMENRDVLEQNNYRGKQNGSVAIMTDSNGSVISKFTKQRL